MTTRVCSRCNKVFEASGKRCKICFKCYKPRGILSHKKRILTISSN